MKKNLLLPLLGIAALSFFNPQTVNASDLEHISVHNTIIISETGHEGIMAIGAPSIQMLPSTGKHHELVSADPNSPQALEWAKLNKAEFQQTEGTVSMIVNEEAMSFVRLTWGEDMMADFIIEDSTVLVDENGIISLDNLEIGDTVTAYYIQPMAMTFIYPPRYPASVLVKPSENVTIHAGFFADQIADHKEGLVVTLNPENPRLNAHGEAHEGSLEYKFLVVFYTESTPNPVIESLPAEIIPNKVIALDILVNPETATLIRNSGSLVGAEPYVVIDTIPLEGSEDAISIKTTGIYVHGTKIDAPEVYVSESGNTMVPLRAVAEALGYGVDWNQELQRVSIGVATFISIGEDEYMIGRMAPRSLGQAPELKNDVTFVPVEFFSQILGVAVN